MIAVNKDINAKSSAWQSDFVAMLPEIRYWLRLAFCRLKPEAREEAAAEAIAHCLLAYVRLHEQGRPEVATPSSLAWYASRHVRCGRPAVGSMNGRDPLSRYAHVVKRIKCERHSSNWIETLAEDKRASVPEQVAAKIDVAAWFSTLTHRMKQIAKDLAVGSSTSEVARKHGVTAGRISQLRRWLEQSWANFQQEHVPTPA
jgi:hypothetical protein